MKAGAFFTLAPIALKIADDFTIYYQDVYQQKNPKSFHLPSLPLRKFSRNRRDDISIVAAIYDAIRSGFAPPVGSVPDIGYIRY
jgi:hypothetical protein